LKYAHGSSAYFSVAFAEGKSAEAAPFDSRQVVIPLLAIVALEELTPSCFQSAS
jgi:uncharacterized membrane protein